MRDVGRQRTYVRRDDSRLTESTMVSLLKWALHLTQVAHLDAYRSRDGVILTSNCVLLSFNTLGKKIINKQG